MRDILVTKARLSVVAFPRNNPRPGLSCLSCSNSCLVLPGLHLDLRHCCCVLSVLFMVDLPHVVSLFSVQCLVLALLCSFALLWHARRCHARLSLVLSCSSHALHGPAARFFLLLRPALGIATPPRPIRRGSGLQPRGMPVRFLRTSLRCFHGASTPCPVSCDESQPAYWQGLG